MIRSILLLTLGLFLLGCGSSSTVKVRDGKTAYETKQYAVAIPLLRSEHSKADLRLERGRLAYMLGESYKALQQPEEAIEWYQRAYDNAYGVDALKEKAYLLKMTEQYDEAARTFQDLSFEIGSPYEYRKDIQACELAQAWLKNERNPYQVNLTDFNTGKAEYAPAIWRNDFLVFTSDRAGTEGEEIYNWTGNYFSDLYRVDLNTGAIEPFSKNLNTPFNEGTATFTADGNRAYFTRCSGEKKLDQYCQIMYSDWNGNGWSPPQALPFSKPQTNYMHPVLGPDGKSLYFSSDDTEGYGGYDIYVSVLEEDEWTLPRPLSAAINTSGNEQFPTFRDDTLFFSSDRHTSIGGLDIFKTYKMTNGAWAPAFNMKPPINSGGDDFSLVYLSGKNLPDGDVLERAYFSSSRSGGAGGDDIYLLEKVKLPPPPEPPVVETEPEEGKLELEVFVVEKIYQDPANPNSAVLGRRPIPAAELAINFGDQDTTVMTGEGGSFILNLEPGQEYGFLASKEGYLRNTGEFSAEGLNTAPTDQLYELEIQLERIFFDTEVVLENIYYDFNEAFIREDAKPTLNELATRLELNPEIRIELSSHTDCRGSDPFNMDLSQRRAQSAVDYLVSKGISEDRLIAQGYGETQPANDCVCSRCTEDEHQENRRTAFKVLGSF
jgi:outer membrane protein OmpA-like peptidoglycan-associated protein/tetratricopeptide (TPR) repeat protein